MLNQLTGCHKPAWFQTHLALYWPHEQNHLHRDSQSLEQRNPWRFCYLQWLLLSNVWWGFWHSLRNWLHWIFFLPLRLMILTHKVIALDEHSDDPYTIGIYDTEEIAQRVADSYNLMYDAWNSLTTAHVIKNNWWDFSSLLCLLSSVLILVLSC